MGKHINSELAHEIQNRNAQMTKREEGNGHTGITM